MDEEKGVQKVKYAREGLGGTARKKEFAKANEFNILMAGFVWVLREEKGITVAQQFATQ